MLQLSFGDAQEFGAEILSIIDDGTYTQEELIVGLAGALSEAIAETERGFGDRERAVDCVVDFLTGVEFDGDDGDPE